MPTLTLYYSIRNGGDGSAHIVLMESDALAQYDQDHMSEGWGETCKGNITLDSDSPILCNKEIETAAGYLVNLIESENEDEIGPFIEEFFPEGKPNFTVTTETTGNEKYLYNNVFVDGAKVGRVFLTLEESGQVFEDLLNA